MHVYCSLNGNRELESTTSSASGPTWPGLVAVVLVVVVSVVVVSVVVVLVLVAQQTQLPTTTALEVRIQRPELTSYPYNIEQLRSPRPSDLARKYMIRYNKKISY